ncbi:hypothetical protein [Amycolatopsis alkalitolerans]|uniref:hypothetical protein n=1 Tax=Amycolatopsis alkalitolerans TaxID=2547244 RepID=UPI00135BFC41|nr:hypothetical protein [Amycolatopsis alkalitolerans]
MTSTATTTSSSSGGTTSSPVKTTTSSKPSESTSSSTPQEPPYQDDTGYGVDLGDGYGLVIIACAAGEPTGLTSPQFDVLEGPYQEEQDGRYWDYLMHLHDGLTFANDPIEADWTCGGTPDGGGASGGGTPITPVAGSGDAASWQNGNGGNAQVRFAPKEGVETGFGGTAQG